MKKYTKLLSSVAATLAVASMVFSACKKEDPVPEPEPEPDTTYNEYSDSTGLEISDSIIVIFGETTWKTLDYTSHIDSEYTSTQAFNEWVVLEAHPKNASYPRVKLRFLKEEGNHTTHLSINNPGIGHTIPGRMVGDIKGGDIRYYEHEELYQPDGTRTSDWWPLDITNSVLEYDQYRNTVTARFTGHMFNYKQWIDASINNEPIDVEAADSCSITVTFGRLKIIHD